MPPPGWVSVMVREELVLLLDQFLRQSGEGYGSRSEVVAAALRQFLRKNQGAGALAAAARPVPPRAKRPSAGGKARGQAP